ncbi:MAG: hypothetical protein MMC23_004562 [Stictis urceolatum]|nr:hypothetical protein [Stictis urceolata]
MPPLFSGLTEEEIGERSEDVPFGTGSVSGLGDTGMDSDDVFTLTAASPPQAANGRRGCEEAQSARERDGLPDGALPRKKVKIRGPTVCYCGDPARADACACSAPNRIHLSRDSLGHDGSEAEDYEESITVAGDAHTIGTEHEQAESCHQLGERKATEQIPPVESKPKDEEDFEGPGAKRQKCAQLNQDARKMYDDLLKDSRDVYDCLLKDYNALRKKYDWQLEDGARLESVVDGLREYSLTLIN